MLPWNDWSILYHLKELPNFDEILEKKIKSIFWLLYDLRPRLGHGSSYLCDVFLLLVCMHPSWSYCLILLLCTIGDLSVLVVVFSLLLVWSYYLLAILVISFLYRFIVTFLYVLNLFCTFSNKIELIEGNFP